ncbi:hypothetical protein [uncultured Winogradskyella sp.]|uniref:hypothetical protein n=1 Tax=uncultured Winogradskyella sp. TaxID=395353 RepID=UPI00260EB8F3|nr:hypothetical protein [uncultured Winogradskyella sp.]
MKKIFFSIVAVISLIQNVNANSPQVPDYIIFKRDTIAVYNLLVEKYFDNLKKENNGELFGLKFRESSTTFCWRGYQAVYEIDDDSLFVKHIIYCGELFDGNKLNIKDSNKRLKEFFKNKVNNNRVFVDWYSGSLNLPKESLLRWDGVFHKTFEKETSIDIGAGEIMSISIIENYVDALDRINRKYNDTVSKVLHNELSKLNWNSEKDFDCSEKYIVTIGKDGEVSDVIMSEYQTRDEIKEFWDRKEYNYCLKTVRKGLKDLKFDILKMDGVSIEESYYVEIWIIDNGKLDEWSDY